MKRFFRIFLGGLLALAPLLITVAATVWLVRYANSYIGPQSTIGSFLTTLGLSLDQNNFFPYLAGLALVVLFVCMVGLLVETRLGPWFAMLLESVVLRIPIVSTVYSTVKRFVSIVDLSDNDRMKSMSPVWCFFGGNEQSAAVLALLPTSDLVRIGSGDYLGIIVPSAPVPIGGALIYVPAAWIKETEGGVDHLMSVYVSMGVTPPMGLRDTQALPTGAVPETPPTPAPTARPDLTPRPQES
ncbi:MAG: DUF502 domain-containing protein [Pseudomonadota bacterium]